MYTYKILLFHRTLGPIENIEDKEYIEDKKIEDRCFFCEENLTRDRIGIRSICPICLGMDW